MPDMREESEQSETNRNRTRRVYRQQRRVAGAGQPVIDSVDPVFRERNGFSGHHTSAQRRSSRVSVDHLHRETLGVLGWFVGECPQLTGLRVCGECECERVHDIVVADSRIEV